MCVWLWKTIIFCSIKLFYKHGYSFICTFLCVCLIFENGGNTEHCTFITYAIESAADTKYLWDLNLLVVDGFRRDGKHSIDDDN